MNNKIFNICFSVFCVLLSVGIGAYCIYKGYPVLILFFFMPFIAILLHELGHLIFGLIFGYKFVYFQISCFLIYKVDKKIVFKFTPLSLSTFFLGTCFMLPKNDTKNDYRGYYLYFLGGIIVNLTCCVVTLILMLALNLNRTISLLFFIFHLGTALSAIVPLGAPNDVMHVLKLLQSKETGRGIYLVQCELYNRVIM